MRALLLSLGFAVALAGCQRDAGETTTPASTAKPAMTTSASHDALSYAEPAKVDHRPGARPQGRIRYEDDRRHRDIHARREAQARAPAGARHPPPGHRHGRRDQKNGMDENSVSGRSEHESR